MNIQTINNKYYTELDVVMVETFKTNNIGDIILNEDKTRLATINPLTIDSKQVCTNQHLYFLSNEKPKRYDDVYHTLLNTIFQLSDDCSQEYIDKAENIRKVEATTDSSLTKEIKMKCSTCNGSGLNAPNSCNICQRTGIRIEKEKISQIPQQFIEHFITEFNKLDSFSAKGNVITKVKVKVDLHDNDISCDKWKIIINNNEVIPLIDVLENTPFHKPDFSHLKVQTAVDWLIEQLVNKQNGEITTLSHLSLDQIYNQAKVIQREHIENAFDDGVSFASDKVYSDINGEKYYKSRFKQ